MTKCESEHSNLKRCQLKLVSLHYKGSDKVCIWKSEEVNEIASFGTRHRVTKRKFGRFWWKERNKKVCGEEFFYIVNSINVSL